MMFCSLRHWGKKYVSIELEKEALSGLEQMLEEAKRRGYYV